MIQHTDISRKPNKSITRNLIGLEESGWNSKDFWRMADELQDDTLRQAKELFAFVKNADVHSLRAILIQYRFFTIYYISDLALLIAKLADGKIRSFLAEILSDELGRGDPSKAHPNLYDAFLVSVGIEKTQLNDVAMKKNIELLGDVRNLLVNNSGEFGIGLRGMGGECVCQVYLSLLHEYLILNPYIQRNKNQIHWAFWDLHVGEHDIEHRMETRKLIHSEIVAKDDTSIHQLGLAYEESMRSWEQFWNNIFSAVTQTTESPEFMKI